jgi:HicA toxin of bacterial toxin-antitoxin,
MPSPGRTLARILTAQADANIRFSDLRRLLARLGFSERIRGDHFIYTHEGIDEIINLQPRGAEAKPYQVRQVRALISKYALKLEDAE